MDNEEIFYSRQIKLVGLEGQSQLQAASILVIGAGGLGCPALLYLAAMGVGHIGILDHDIIEQSNLNRQILYTQTDIGKSKSEVAAQKITEQNPFIKVKFFNEKFQKENSALVFKDYEIIVDCTDNFETKFLIHDCCFYQKKKLVQANVYQFEGNLHVFNFSHKLESDSSPCLRCLWSSEPEDGVVGTCKDVGILGVTVGLLGTLMANEVYKLIWGKNELQNGEGLFVNLVTHDFEKRKWKKNSQCSFCIKNSKQEIRNKTNYSIGFNEAKVGFVWIDLRTDDDRKEFPMVHQVLIHMPMNSFNISKLGPENKYLLICQRGHQSLQMARALQELGHDNFFSLENGIQNFK